MIEEGFWLGQAIGKALIEHGYFQPKPAHSPAVEPPTPTSYTCTLRGVYCACGRLKAAFGYKVDGKRRGIYLGSGPATWEEEQRLHTLWKAARQLHQAGATVEEIRRSVEREG